MSDPSEGRRERIVEQRAEHAARRQKARKVLKVRVIDKATGRDVTDEYVVTRRAAPTRPPVE